jgi:hypothetical protein
MLFSFIISFGSHAFEPSSTQADLEMRKRAVASEMEVVQKGCEAELTRLRGDLKMALDLLVQHRMWLKQRVEGVLTAAKQVHSEVQHYPCPV